MVAVAVAVVVGVVVVVAGGVVVAVVVRGGVAVGVVVVVAVAVAVGVGVVVVVAVAVAVVVGAVMFVVFDLDGTLADDSHRHRHIDGTDAGWDKYYAACPDDAPNWPAIKTLCAHMQAGHRAEIWTGRRAEYQAATRHQLAGWGIPASRLTRMRPAGCRRSAVVLKSEWLRAADNRVDLAYDDRDDVVAMWRAAGVPCFQVAPWVALPQLSKELRL